NNKSKDIVANALTREQILQAEADEYNANLAAEEEESDGYLDMGIFGQDETTSRGGRGGDNTADLLLNERQQDQMALDLIRLESGGDAPAIVELTEGMTSRTRSKTERYEIERHAQARRESEILGTTFKPRGGRWTKAERTLLMSHMTALGADYSLIAGLIPGRDRRQVRNEVLRIAKRDPHRIVRAIARKDIEQERVLVSQLEERGEKLAAVEDQEREEDGEIAHGGPIVRETLQDIAPDQIATGYVPQPGLEGGIDAIYGMPEAAEGQEVVVPGDEAHMDLDDLF
ncbi:hypothetical protein KIPB_008754, partial [Kipferlia bialata]